MSSQVGDQRAELAAHANLGEKRSVGAHPPESRDARPACRVNGMTVRLRITLGVIRQGGQVAAGGADTSSDCADVRGFSLSAIIPSVRPSEPVRRESRSRRFPDIRSGIMVHHATHSRLQRRPMRLWGVGLLHLAVALSLSQLPAGAQTAGGGGTGFAIRRPFRARVTANPTCQASGRPSTPPTTTCCPIPRARTFPPGSGW